MPKVKYLQGVTLCWKTKTPKGWRYFPAMFESRHGEWEVMPGLVMEGVVQRQYPKGRFFIRTYVKGKKVYTPVDGCHPRDAALALQNAYAAVDAARRETKGSTEYASAERHHSSRANKRPSTLKDAAAAYVTYLEKKTHFEAAGAARVCLAEFREVTKVVYLSKIALDDVLTFHKALRERGLSDRTVTNKHDRLCSFLRFSNVHVEGLHKTASSKGIRPSYEDPEVTTYDDRQMQQLREAADDYMRLVIDMGQQLGLRMQEIMYAEWADLKGCLFTVQGKIRQRYTFKVKDKEARTVPVNDALCARLAAWKASRPGTVLILGTGSDKPNRHLLRTLKRMVQRERLNCGRCKGCNGGEGCYEWTLHRFRRTYLTKLLRAGVDLKTVQRMAGHSDLASTQRYLDALNAESVQPVVNAIKW